MEKKYQEKAEYCLNCKVKPCRTGCPLENSIPDFIREAKEGNMQEAYHILSQTTVLESICGRICPHEKQCQSKCVRGIKGEPVSIGELEAYIGDTAIRENYPMEKEEKKEGKIAVIGAGPAGLTCSAFLTKKGYSVTIFEKYEELGGILAHGIPAFRLDPEVRRSTIQKILDLGMEVKTKQELGKDFTISDLEKNYDAVFLGIGANISSKMGIEGEELNGVYGGNELLEFGNHPNYQGKKVAVIGGGNVAMDTARTIKRMGAKEVTIIYRRAEEQMPAERKEIREAKEEGVQFLFTTNITKILGKESVERVECIKTELVQKEGETRLSPVNIEGSNYEIDMDYVVMALGSKPEEGVTKELGITLNRKGGIQIDEQGRTSKENIFAGGDIASNKGTIAWAARAGRDAAFAIDQYLTEKRKDR